MDIFFPCCPNVPVRKQIRGFAAYLVACHQDTVVLCLESKPRSHITTFVCFPQQLECMLKCIKNGDCRATSVEGTSCELFRSSHLPSGPATEGWVSDRPDYFSGCCELIGSTWTMGWTCTGRMVGKKSFL